MGKKKKCMYTTQQRYTFVIYILKVVPDRFPSMNAPRNLPYQGKCLVSERRLAGTNRQKASFSLSLFSPIDWLHLGTLIRLTFPICVLPYLLLTLL